MVRKVMDCMAHLAFSRRSVACGGEDWLVDMVSERFIELVERVSMCGGFVAIMKRKENVDVDEKTYFIFYHYSVLCRREMRI